MDSGTCFLGWCWPVWPSAVSIACAALLPLVAFLIPEHPGDVGTGRFGETPASAPSPPLKQASTATLAFTVLFRGARHPVFWLLFGSFFVCGLTTNGLIGTHMIAFCGDHGIAPVAAAGLLSTMGFFDLFGTSASGWLTDRFGLCWQIVPRNIGELISHPKAMAAMMGMIKMDLPALEAAARES